MNEEREVDIIKKEKYLRFIHSERVSFFFAHGFCKQLLSGKSLVLKIN